MYLLCSGIARETVGRPDPWKPPYKRPKERKTLRVRAASRVHTQVWEYRWADNACCKKLETMKLMDGRFRLDEYKGRAKLHICEGHCLAMDRRKKRVQVCNKTF